ncbi:hypothetical protein D3C76_1501090 [compost metagenome]
MQAAFEQRHLAADHGRIDVQDIGCLADTSVKPDFVEIAQTLFLQFIVYFRDLRRQLTVDLRATI